MDRHNAISRRMRERLRVIFKWSKFIKETDSDWELGQQWEQQYFLQKKEQKEKES